LNIKKLIFILVFFAFGLQGFTQYQGKDNFTEEWEKMHKIKERALKNFNEAKFGLFITWGVYSLPAGIWKDEKIRGLGEWIMHTARIVYSIQW